MKCLFRINPEMPERFSQQRFYQNYFTQGEVSWLLLYKASNHFTMCVCIYILFYKVLLIILQQIFLPSERLEFFMLSNPKGFLTDSNTSLHGGPCIEDEDTTTKIPGTAGMASL